MIRGLENLRGAIVAAQSALAGAQRRLTNDPRRPSFLVDMTSVGRSLDSAAAGIQAALDEIDQQLAAEPLPTDSRSWLQQGLDHLNGH